MNRTANFHKFPPHKWSIPVFVASAGKCDSSVLCHNHDFFPVLAFFNISLEYYSIRPSKYLI